MAKGSGGTKGRPRRGELLPVQGSVPLSLRKRRFDLQRGLTHDDLVNAALERVTRHLFALKVETVKFDPSAILDGETREAAEKRLKRLLGADAVAIFFDRIVYIQDHASVQLQAAQEILSRRYPLPNRLDAKNDRVWSVERVDPNEPGQAAKLLIHERSGEPEPVNPDDLPL